MFDTSRTIYFLLGIHFRLSKLEKKIPNMTPSEAREAAFHFVRPESAAFLQNIPVRVIYHGIEYFPETSGILFAGNHQSYFDIPILLACMESPTGFVGKSSLQKIPLIGRIMRLLECVFMDREDLRQSLDAIKSASELLKEGMNVVIFPEGTRSRSDEIGEFHKGSLKAATMVGAPIVPFRIDGAHAIFESNRGFSVKPREVHVYFGEPIYTDTLSRVDQKDLSANFENIVKSLP